MQFVFDVSLGLSVFVVTSMALLMTLERRDQASMVNMLMSLDKCMKGKDIFEMGYGENWGKTSSLRGKYQNAHQNAQNLSKN